MRPRNQDKAIVVAVSLIQSANEMDPEVRAETIQGSETLRDPSFHEFLDQRAALRGWELMGSRRRLRHNIYRRVLYLSRSHTVCPPDVPACMEFAHLLDQNNRSLELLTKVGTQC